METIIPTQETTDSTSTGKQALHRSMAASAAVLALMAGGCGKNNSASDTNPATCSPDTKPGDFTITATFPHKDTAKTAEIRLTSDEQFSLGEMSDGKAPGDWVTQFSQQSSYNTAIKKDGEYVMAFENPDLNGHLAHLSIVGHGEGSVTCEVSE